MKKGNTAATQSSAESQVEPTGTQSKQTTAPQAKFIPMMGEIRIPQPKLTPTAIRQEGAARDGPDHLKSMGAGESESESDSSEEVQSNEETADQEVPNPVEGFMDKEIQAEQLGDREGAEMYYAMYKASRARTSRKREATPQEWYEEPKVEEIPSKDGKESANAAPLLATNKESEVGGLCFVSGAMPRHDNMGFTPYFDNNIRQLKGPIPLTIFNCTWKNAVIIHHVEKRSRLDDLSTNRNRYTGYPYPSKWTQSFSKWTINHHKFYLTIRDIYIFGKMAKWILEHKQNADEIQAEEGFMVALCYKIQIRTNAFAHWVTLADGSKLVADILIMREKVRNTCYAMARRFNKLEFKDINPYAPGQAREDWDPTTGSKRQSKKENPTHMTSAQPEAGPSNASKAPAAKQQRQSGYKGSNFDPNYSQSSPESPMRVRDC
ncbi:hypothetical protein PCASD_20022 [Puccinia coronata f. sp. avenae]|uniref:Uncharacterized protein n=1 Tax=Puccinia coronata f. sp. avenae TaxID=200324 RepID=A0A2N5TAI3_9BASI|nr:hypothetical protein PCASD_20022 [Puccinia coronata f. sp. avenae]